MGIDKQSPVMKPQRCGIGVSMDDTTRDQVYSASSFSHPKRDLFLTCATHISQRIRNSAWHLWFFNEWMFPLAFRLSFSSNTSGEQSANETVSLIPRIQQAKWPLGELGGRNTRADIT